MGTGHLRCKYTVSWKVVVMASDLDLDAGFGIRVLWLFRPGYYARLRHPHVALLAA